MLVKFIALLLFSQTNALDPAQTILKCQGWLDQRPNVCEEYMSVLPCQSTNTKAELSAVTEAPITVDAFPPKPDHTSAPRNLSPHNLDLHTVCGDLAGSQFRKLKSVLGLAKETLQNGPFYKDLFFNRTRRHFDEQDSKQILKFVSYMEANHPSLHAYEQERLRSRSTRDVKRHRHKREKTKNAKNRKPSVRKLKALLKKTESTHSIYWPWHVHIRSYHYEHAECSGMLLSSRVVITTAHCFRKFDFETSDVKNKIEIDTDNKIFLYAGFENRTQLETLLSITDEQERHQFAPFVQRSSSDTVHMHQYWISGTHNVAIIQLHDDQPFVLNDRVQPICLPYRELNIKPKTVSLVAGFGQNDHLKLVPVDVQKSDRCNKLARTHDPSKMFSSEWDRLHFQSIDDKGIRLCMGKKSPFLCKTDETSAAIVPHNDRMSLLGLASIQPSSCKSSGLEMYTRIAPLLPFIEQFITGWSAWTAWSDCAAECGKSKKYRARVCETYKEGTTCEGNAVEYVDCYQARCPTWAEWTQWTQCAPSCGDGRRIRTRQCSAGGGPSDLAKPKYCQGPQQQAEECTGQPCKPYWDYLKWGACGCDSMFVTREKVCKKRHDENAVHDLPDQKCAGLPHEPLVQQCSAPVNPENCKALITGGIKTGQIQPDAVFTPNALKKNDSIEIYNHVKLWGHNLAVMNDRVFLFGGRSVSSGLNEKFSELKAWRGDQGQVILEWVHMEKFNLGNYKRYYAAHSVNTDDNTIMMCGGKNKETAENISLIKTCLLFSLETGWKTETELNEVIVSPTMVWHNKTKHHYLIGGEKDPELNSIACDDVKRYKNGKWSDFVRLPNRVVGAQSIVIDDIRGSSRIYVFGGDMSGSIYSIDPESENAWRSETRMGSPRSSFPIVRIGPRVWLFGTYTDKNRNIERFDLNQEYSHNHPLPYYNRASWMHFSDGAAAIRLPQSFLHPTSKRAQPAYSRKQESKRRNYSKRKSRRNNST